MTTRHTSEPDDQRPEHQRVPVAATGQRRGAMYMRAEARRAAELGVATAPPPPRNRSAPRRLQLAAFAAVWLVIAGVTAVVGVRWARQQRTSPPPVVRTTPTRSPVTEVRESKPAPVATPGQSTSAPAAVAQPASSSGSVSVPNRAATRDVKVATTRPVVTSNSVANATANRGAARARSNAVASARSTTARSAAAARLVITSNPAGAVVTVDGIGWGTTPAKIGYLPPGAKRVRVTKEGYASREATIRVVEGQPASLNLVLQPLRATAARH